MPADVLMGPHIPTWADPRVLERLDEVGVNHPERGDLIWRYMYSALTRHRAALREYGSSQGLDHLATMRLVQHRRPYWTTTDWAPEPWNLGPGHRSGAADPR